MHFLFHPLVPIFSAFLSPFFTPFSWDQSVRKGNRYRQVLRTRGHTPSMRLFLFLNKKSLIGWTVLLTMPLPPNYYPKYHPRPPSLVRPRGSFCHSRLYRPTLLKFVWFFLLQTLNPDTFFSNQCYSFYFLKS